MGSAENFRQYAADCVRRAEGEPTPEDRNILLNVALAWVRLARQSQAVGSAAASADDTDAPAATQAGDDDVNEEARGALN
jgi:hypothetical protein